MKLLTFSLPVLLLATSAAAQTPVRVAEVVTKTMQQRQAVTGTLRAVARGDVAALESGRLLTLTVREGEQVKQGDVIATIDARRLQAQKKQAEAELLVAKAELKRHQAEVKLAEAELSRSRKLVERRATSSQEFDRAQAQKDVAVAQQEAAARRIQQTQENIELLKIQISDTQVNAPYDASVVERHVEPGDWLQPGDKLLTLVSTGPIEAWLEVPERFASAVVNHGDSVAVRSRAIESSLRVLSTKRVADVNSRIRTMNFVVTVQNSDGLLTPGMSVDGWIAAGGREDVVVVPKDAVRRDGGLNYVFAVQESSEGQQAARKAVRVLFETPDSMAIDRQTLQAGVQVVVEGNERLVEGTIVQVVNDVQQSQVASR